MTTQVLDPLYSEEKQDLRRFCPLIMYNDLGRGSSTLREREKKRNFDRNNPYDCITNLEMDQIQREDEPQTGTQSYTIHWSFQGSTILSGKDWPERNDPCHPIYGYRYWIHFTERKRRTRNVTPLTPYNDSSNEYNKQRSKKDVGTGGYLKNWITSGVGALLQWGNEPRSHIWLNTV